MTRTASSPILQLIRQVASDPRVTEAADHELLQRFVDTREEAAFAVLVRRHGSMVLDVCRGVLGNDADAEDAFQATFLVLSRKASSIRKGGSLASWLHGVAHRTALKARANAGRRQRHEARAPERCATADPDALTWREVRRAVHEELERLPAQQRAALVVCYLEGKTQDEAARQLGLPKGTLKGHLERGRARLRARLVRRGLGPTALLLMGAWPAACASAPLLAVAVRTALGTAGSVVSPNVAALSERVVRAMFFKKVQIAVVLCCLIAGSAGLAFAMRPVPGADAGEIVAQAAPQVKPQPGDAGAAKPAADPARPIRTLAGHTDRVISVAYSPDGRWIATAGWDATVRLWDAQTGDEVRRLELPATKWYNPAKPSRVLFSPDNQFIVIAQQSAPTERSVIVWKRSTGERVRDFSGLCVAIAPDGKQIACGGWGRPNTNFGAIQLYEFATGKLVRDIQTRYSGIERLTFAPDGQTLFAQVGIARLPLGNGIERSGRDGAQIRAWDVTTGKERRTGFEGAWINLHVALAPDGRTFALASSLRETATGGQRIALTGHAEAVCGVAFAPDGRTVATASMDGTARLWDPHSGKELARLGKLVERGKGGWVLTVAFSPDGRTLVFGGLDKVAQVCDVSSITGRRAQPIERSPAELAADWRDLAGDAPTSYAALSRLVASPGLAVPFLGKHLQGAEPADSKRITRLIAELDDEQFEIRARASAQLEAMAEHAVPALRQALAGAPTLEARRRLEALLDRLDGVRPSPETLRQLRAVETLERIGNAEARRLLDTLAAAPGQTPLTQAAAAAASRLASVRKK